MKHLLALAISVLFIGTAAAECIAPEEIEDGEKPVFVGQLIPATKDADLLIVLKGDSGFWAAYTAKADKAGKPDPDTMCFLYSGLN
jgi:hypothetical protein